MPEFINVAGIQMKPIHLVVIIGLGFLAWHFWKDQIRAFFSGTKQEPVNPEVAQNYGYIPPITQQTVQQNQTKPPCCLNAKLPLAQLKVDRAVGMTVCAADLANLTEIEKQLGIINETGDDPELIAWRCDRIRKVAKTIADSKKK
jgi:hypothetical protein